MVSDKVKVSVDVPTPSATTVAGLAVKVAPPMVNVTWASSVMTTPSVTSVAW